MSDADRLNSLLQASLALNSALGLDDVLRVLSQFVPAHVGCERATLYRVDPISGDLVSHLVWPVAFDATIRVPIGTGVAGWVAREGKALVVDDVTTDDRFDASHDARTDFTTRSLLAVPIRARDGKLLGVLQALNKLDEGGFDASDLEFVSILAVHAAVALQNARLFDTLTRARRGDDDADVTAAATDPIGKDPRFVEAVEMAKRAARTDASVLLRGESGTGKGVFARLIHRHSARADKTLVEVNCAAIPRDLVESELLGVEKGVATGVEPRKGRLESAHRGTCFLDEIGDMALDAQAKVLKAIEDGKVERVGGRKPVPADARIIAATHQDLEAAIEAGRFRADLYYRLDVVSLRVPALRERPGDVAELAAHFVATKSKRHRLEAPELAAEVIEHLQAYAWPGNVRELENVIERAVVLCGGDTITVGDLPASISGSSGVAAAPRDAGSDLDLKAALERTEGALLRRALEQAEGVQTEAARLLGISESNLRYRLKKLEG